LAVTIPTERYDPIAPDVVSNPQIELVVEFVEPGADERPFFANRMLVTIRILERMDYTIAPSALHAPNFPWA
jgi:hypothetical protein